MTKNVQYPTDPALDQKPVVNWFSTFIEYQNKASSV